MKKFQLHMKNPAHDLLAIHGNIPLMAGMTWEDIRRAKEIVTPLLDGAPTLDVGIAYLAGVMQGIHNARAAT